MHVLVAEMPIYGPKTFLFVHEAYEPTPDAGFKPASLDFRTTLDDPRFAGRLGQPPNGHGWWLLEIPMTRAEFAAEDMRQCEVDQAEYERVNGARRGEAARIDDMMRAAE